MKFTLHYRQYEPHSQLLQQSTYISFGGKLILISNVWSRDSVAGNATGMWAGWYEVIIPSGQRDFFFNTSRSALGPTQPPSQWVPGALSHQDQATKT